MLNNAELIAELEEQRDYGRDYGVREALYLALLTGKPIALPGTGNGNGMEFVGSHQHDEDGNAVYDWVTCGTCGLTWNDALITSITPAPSARCPFEYLHEDDADG